MPEIILRGDSWRRSPAQHQEATCVFTSHRGSKVLAIERVACAVERADGMAQRFEDAALIRRVGAAEVVGPDAVAEARQEILALARADRRIEAEKDILLLPHIRPAIVGENCVGR